VRSWAALGALVALLVGAGTLIAVELSQGAVDTGESEILAPCQEHPSHPGDGIDATIQRVVLDGLEGAACRLGTTREELVLSLEPQSGVRPIRWDDETIERAVRAGLLEAIDDAQQRDSVNNLIATVMRGIVERAPLQWLIDGGQQIAGLFD
jgi:hypothetical protein